MAQVPIQYVGKIQRGRTTTRRRGTIGLLQTIASISGTAAYSRIMIQEADGGRAIVIIIIVFALFNGGALYNIRQGTNCHKLEFQSKGRFRRERKGNGRFMIWMMCARGLS